jgi:hypothetical protein
VEQIREGAVVPYSGEGAPPLSYETRVLLAVGTVCAALHVALAACAAARLAAWRGVVSFSGFWAAYYVAEAVLRTVLPAFLVAGAAGVWSGRRSAARWAVRAAAGLVALGAVEVVVSLVSFFTGPPRPKDLPGVLLGIGQTFFNRYAPLLLLAYVLLRPPPVPVREYTP